MGTTYSDVIILVSYMNFGKTTYHGNTALRYASRGNNHQLRVCSDVLHIAADEVVACDVKEVRQLVTKLASVPLERSTSPPLMFRSNSIPLTLSQSSADSCINSTELVDYKRRWFYGGITTTIKHAIKLTIKLKTSPGPARLAQLLQPSLAFCCKLQPMTAYRPCRTCF